MPIAARTVASFHYTLTNTKGEVLDSSRGGQPLHYLHGAGNLIPGMENALAGKSPGDKFQAVVPPEEGYGVIQANMIQIVPMSAFGGAKVEEGMRFQADSDHGPMRVRVSKVEGDQVTVDGNHELAGETLHFDIEVISVRDATLEEITHGHVHGPGGHHH